MKLDKYMPLVLRIGLGFVFFWFGIDKLINPFNWMGYVSPGLSKLLFFDIGLFILLLGILEIILGVMLIVGIFTRIVAFIVALHLFFVIVTIGFNEISVRDIGLLSIAIALILNKEKHLEFNIKWLRKKTNG